MKNFKLNLFNKPNITIIYAVFILFSISTLFANNTMCTPPDSFDYETVQDGDWNDSNTWAEGMIPNAENNANQLIKISHNVSLTNGNVKLDNSAILYVSGEDSSLAIMNGNLYIDGTDSKAIFLDTVISIAANVEQKVNTFVCMNNIELSVGQEEAGESFTGATSTSANFKNDGGYRSLENICANITGNYNNLGEDHIIDSSIDIGDQGAADKDIDGSDSGDFKNESGTMSITNSEFYIPNGDFLNSSSLAVLGVGLRLFNGNIQNSTNGEINGSDMVLWVSNGDIQNAGIWDGALVSDWLNENENTPQGFNNLPASTDIDSIALQFLGCVDPIGPDQIVGPMTVSVVQNPAVKDGIKVSFNNTLGTRTQVSMFDIKGTLVYNTETNGSIISIASNQLNTGVYIISIENESRVVKKIMIK